MRIFLASVLSAGCVAALFHAGVVHPGNHTGSTDDPLVSPLQRVVATAAGATVLLPGIAADGGRTTTIALAGPGRPGALRAVGDAPDALPAVRPTGGTGGLAARTTEPFALFGLTWDDPRATLDGSSVRARTRSTQTGAWSDWQSLSVDSDDRPDSDSGESTAPGARGGTAPLWAGPSDGLELQISPAAADPRHPAAPELPAGLRVDLVDPGRGAAPGSAPPALAPAPAGAAPAAAGGRRLDPVPYQGPRPGIRTRAGWGADETLREEAFGYTGTVRAVFVHHTATGNNYACADAPQMIRSIYRYHVQSNGWRDIGYNFLVDKCGTIYEGRAGGVDQSVLGAHTLGFNTDSAGVAAIGTFSDSAPPKAMLDGIAKITAWKLGLTGQDPTGSVDLVSADSGSRYPKGSTVSFRTVSGHRDAFNTECPGGSLYPRLAAIRATAAHLQGR